MQRIDNGRDESFEPVAARGKKAEGNAEQRGDRRRHSGKIDGGHRLLPQADGCAKRGENGNEQSKPCPRQAVGRQPQQDERARPRKVFAKGTHRIEDINEEGDTEGLDGVEKIDGDPINSRFPGGGR